MTQRFISIEGYTSDQHVTCVTSNGRTTCNYDGPALTASWLDGQGNVMGSGALTAFVDDQKIRLPALESSPNRGRQ